LIVAYESFGQTPLNQEEMRGLIPAWVATHADLNLAEQTNIADAEPWCFAVRTRRAISEIFANRVHKRMFGDVWDWAGTYRKSDKNIGSPFYEIPTRMRQLFDEAEFWIENRTYPPDQLAIRLKHRLVAIHPYANGNGRHSRMMGDLALFQLAGERFGWGRGRRDRGEDSEAIRRDYIAALRSADDHDYGPLLAFARS
jgi:Fic-DOC domain mobile mystery protein B